MQRNTRKLPNKDIRFALGSAENLGKATNLTEPLTKFSRRFQKPLVTPEKRHEFLKKNDRQQNYLKGIAGWFMRAEVEKGKRNRRSIEPGDLLTFDIDYATPEFMEKLQAGKVLPGIALFVHTTRSHTPEKPRLRLILPLKIQIASERYAAVNRIVSQLIDPEMELIDKVSARVAQMMYLPTCSSDMEKHFVYYEQHGALADWEKAVASWEAKNGSSEDLSKLPRYAGEGELREIAEKAEDPLEKDGIVGTFCRAYSITELVLGKDGEEPLLGDCYEITEWKDGVATRMTYLHGSTSNGAVVYDDKFVFSHHGSDPGQEQLLNAYDLMRVHKFNSLEDDQDAPMKDRDSVKAINKHVIDLPGYQLQAVEERYDLEEMFSDDDDQSWVEDATEDDEDEQRKAKLLEGLEASRAADKKNEDEELAARAMELLGVQIETRDPRTRYKRMLASKPPKNWVATELELGTDGAIKSTLHNIATIVKNDPRFYRKIAWNDFSKQTVLLADIKTKSDTIPTVACDDTENGMLWNDIYDITIRAVVEAPNGRGKPGYGFKVSDRDLVGGVKLAARNNAFHPIKELLGEARERDWDGKDRISTFLHDVAGAEVNQYTADVMRTMMMASIARIYCPGHKFDYAIILEGSQGIGKSTLIKHLYYEDYFGELDAKLDDRREAAEQIAGKWVMELPELGSLHKADHNSAKQFMRREDDDVREAYGRTVSRFPRQCVFWGTTNDDEYLRDPTGNRSYWPVKCNGFINLVRVIQERDQLWAQAIREYDELCQKYPMNRLPLTLTGDALEDAKKRQESARSKEMWEEWVEDIIEWVYKPVQLGFLAAENGWHYIDELSDETERYVVRTSFSQQQAAHGALGLRKGAFTNPTQQTAWNKAKKELGRRGWITGYQCRIQGHRQRWYFPPGLTETARVMGYSFADDAEHTGDSSTPNPNDGDHLI
ncbi:virulence-associated E family protein [Oceanicola sp. 502str15]|uniref:virulence-associated E family protein n=1 Tax=Oceanicola sp. 502str15 TaxID=2696061 RepID=UPI002094B792|nr:virulence-associated E family protein [Oceanicola sp. 502str15]MCO6384621.1 hypothetical protein [Oceanicola sp. 502str15]